MADFKTSNITGIIYVENSDQLPQSEKEIALYDAYNFEFYKGIGLKKSNGTVQIAHEEGKRVQGLAEYDYKGLKKLIANFNDGKAYEINIGTGLPTEIASGFSANRKITYANYEDGIVINDGVNDPKYLKLSGSVYTEIPVNTPVACKGSPMVIWKNRLFIGAGKTLYWSALGDITDYETLGADGAGNNYTFASESSDITALIVWNDLLLIYKKHKLYYVQGSSDQDTWTFGELSSNKGAISQYGTNNFLTNHWMFDDGLLPLGALGKNGELGFDQEFSKDINSEFEKFYAEKDIFIIPYHKRNQLRLYVTYQGDDYIKNCWIYDFDKKRWFKKEYPHNISFVAVFDQKLYLGTSDGYILIDDTGSTFNGAAIPAEFLLPFMHFGRTDLLKEISEIIMSFDGLETKTFKLLLRFNNQEDGTFTEREVSLSIRKADTLVLAPSDSGQTKWDQYKWAANATAILKHKVNKKFYTMQIGLRCTEITDKVAIRSLTIRDIKLGI